ncbi:hypothetical protein GCM10009030_34960 [Haloarcula pellucida]|uniref:Uncharacterized protein n=1 Tax=Haloarcula pellucida TaxID=1427151 RepID=A0A830GPS2_9EURY|nr:hypothetical protein GCM10009030_34960 [Halomicroarcula pellucida]
MRTAGAGKHRERPTERDCVGRRTDAGRAALVADRDGNESDGDCEHSHHCRGEQDSTGARKVSELVYS